MESLKAALRGSGYSEQATVDIANAMSTLAHYGLLGQNLGFGGPAPPAGTTPTSPPSNTMQNPLAAAAAGYGPPANVQVSMSCLTEVVGLGFGLTGVATTDVLIIVISQVT